MDWAHGCECQPFGLICRAGLCSSFTFWPQWSSTLTTCIHLFYYLSNVQLLFVGIGLENVKMDTSVERSVLPQRVRGFAAWYNKHADIYQRLTLERWHWSALTCCLLIDPPSTDVFTQTAKQLTLCTRSNVYIMCPQVSRPPREPPGLNLSPTINNHFLITQSPMRIPLFTDQHLRLLDLRSRSQQLESQFIVWSVRAENLNPTLRQDLNSHADAVYSKYICSRQAHPTEMHTRGDVMDH